MSENAAFEELLKICFQQLAQEQEANNEVPPELERKIFRTLDLIFGKDNITKLFLPKSDNVPGFYGHEKTILN